MRQHAGARNSLMVLVAVLKDNFASSKLDKKDRQPMHEINQTPPERMTLAQRRCEIASILARGLVRLRMAHSPMVANTAPASDISLAFSGSQSVHSDPVNYRNSES